MCERCLDNMVAWQKKNSEVSKFSEPNPPQHRIDHRSRRTKTHIFGHVTDRKKDETMGHIIYRKKTHTNRSFNAQSLHYRYNYQK